jgi:hypothetical protein
VLKYNFFRKIVMILDLDMAGLSLGPFCNPLPVVESVVLLVEAEVLPVVESVVLLVEAEVLSVVESVVESVVLLVEAEVLPVVESVVELKDWILYFLARN